MKDFDVPYIANIPVELENKLTTQAKQDITYLNLKNQRTLKRFMKTNSKLRQVADFISDYFKNNPVDILSYQEIADSLHFSEGEVRSVVCELAGWDKYPFVIINSPKKTGYFQLHSKDLEDTEKWITKQQRQIASKEQRLDKTQNAILVKRKTKTRLTKKIKIKN